MALAGNLNVVPTVPVFRTLLLAGDIILIALVVTAKVAFAGDINTLFSVVAVSVVKFVGDPSFSGIKEVFLIDKLIAVGNEAVIVIASFVRKVKSAVSFFDVDGFKIAVDTPVSAAVFKSFDIIVLVGLGILIIWDK